MPFVGPGIKRFYGTFESLYFPTSKQLLYFDGTISTFASHCESVVEIGQDTASACGVARFQLIVEKVLSKQYPRLE